MRIPKSLKLNKFVYVRIPSMKEEFVKHGFMAALPTNYSGDETAPAGGRKSDIIADADKFAKTAVQNKPKDKPE